MKPKDWIPYIKSRALPWCRDFVSPAYPVDAVTADFYMSVGGNCRTATQLRRNKLRICSSPLDWMMCYSLKDAAELFKTGFRTFFTDIREHPHSGTGNRQIEDVRNGMISIHHFPIAMTLEEGHEAYRKRAARHFANTHRFMTEADRIAMITNRTESLDDICHFIAEIKSLYKAKIVHINIRHGAEKKGEKLTLPDNSILYDYTFNDVAFSKSVEHQGNDYEWRRILGKCRRTRKFSPP